MMPTGSQQYNVTHLQQFVEQLQSFCLERLAALQTKKANKTKKGAGSSQTSPPSSGPVPSLRLQLAVAAAKSQALGLAAETGKLECAEFLLQAQADVRWCDDLGRTALYRACYVGHLGLVDLLLSYGTDPNTRSQTRLDPLTVAAFKGFNTVYFLLIFLFPIRPCGCCGKTN